MCNNNIQTAGALYAVVWIVWSLKVRAGLIHDDDDDDDGGGGDDTGVEEEAICVEVYGGCAMGQLYCSSGGARLPSHPMAS